MTDPTLADRLEALYESEPDRPLGVRHDLHMALVNNLSTILAALRAPSFDAGREAGIEAAAQWHDRMRRAAAPGTGNATRHEWYARDIRALRTTTTPQAQAPVAVAGLVEKWRKGADDLAALQKVRDIREWRYWMLEGRIIESRAHADELAAAIQGGEGDDR
jgi:hypothetical protein